MDALLKQPFRPEFLNRLDEIVFYKPLEQGARSSRSSTCCSDVLQAARLKDKQLDVQLTDPAKHT